MSKPSEILRIHYEEIPVDKLIEHWVKDYDEPKPELRRWFYDAHKGVMVLSLYVKEKAK